jgi:adenylate cyclase
LVAGYRRLLPGDEADRIAQLRAVLTEIIQPLVGEYGGNLFKEAGDLALSEFESVVEATRCAAALRDAIVETNQTLPPERRIALRIGINLGDIIVERGDVFGDGVNIAARLEALAEPGSIYVSGIVHDQVADKVEYEFEDLGPKELKNIRRPIHVYRMAGVTVERPDHMPAAGAVGPPVFDEHRAIAVLPFANFSDDPEQEFFADGISEDIISLLAGWRAFPVIARNSTFTYKGQTVDIKKVGQELGARYVLEGSVRKSGHRVRVTAQLIRADTNHHIMAERYDRDLTDLFELQDEIVRAIAGAIEPELLKFERERIAERPQHSEDAYELYQRGMFHHYRQNKAENLEAQAYFRRALAIDAQYPQATAALSIALCSAALAGWAENSDACFEQAHDLAQRAVTLDPRYPNAHFALGLVSMWTSRSERATAGGDQAEPELCRGARNTRAYSHLQRQTRRNDPACRASHTPQPQRSASIHLASGSCRRSLPTPPLRAGGRDRAPVLGAQPQLADRSYLCRRRVGSAWAPRGSAVCVGQLQGSAPYGSPGMGASCKTPIQ